MADSNTAKRMLDERDLVMRDIDHLRDLGFAPGIRMLSIEQSRSPLIEVRNREHRRSKKS